MQRLIFILAIAAFLNVLSGCTKEDLSECPAPGVDILCTFTRNETGEDRLPEKMEHMDFFVYDADGTLVETCHVTAGEMTAGPHGMVAEKMLLLPAGSYTIVGWANVKETSHTFVSTGNIGSAVLQTVCEDNGSGKTVSHTMPAVLWGKASLEVPMSRIASCSMDMTQDTHDIHIQIAGPGEYDISLSASNGYYRFDNTPADDSSPITITYLPENPNEPLSTLEQGHTVTVSRSEESGWHNTLRTQSLYIGDDSRVTIRLSGTGDVVFDESLTGLICKDPSIKTDEDLAKIEHYDLKFETDILSGLVLVQVNDWVVKDQNTGV